MDSHSGGFRIGIDPDWTALSPNAKMTPLLNGFVDEVLLEISRYSGLEFVRVRANADSLYQGLGQKSYDAVLSTTQGYSFNTARFDFSRDLLDVGIVLVVPSDSKAMRLEDLAGEVVGVLADDSSELLLQQAPSVIPRGYPMISDLFIALQTSQVEGVLLDRLTASAYVRDLYAGKMRIVGPSLNHQGIHLVVPKGMDKSTRELFDKSVKRLEKSKKLQQIAAKWNLTG